MNQSDVVVLTYYHVLSTALVVGVRDVASGESIYPADRVCGECAAQYACARPL